MRKSSFCHLLNEKIRLTTDRLQRYIHGKTPAKNGDMVKVEELSPSLFKKNNIKKGDFIIVCDDKNYLLVEVLKFQYLNKETFADKRFTKSTVNLEVDFDVGFLGNFYCIGKDAKLCPVITNSYFQTKSYVSHIKPNAFCLKSRMVSTDVTLYLNSL